MTVIEFKLKMGRSICLIEIYINYSYELKLEDVQAVLYGKGVQIVAKKFEVTDPDYIYVWILKYKTYGEVRLKRKIRNHHTLDQDYVIKEQKMENDILKKYLKLRRREGKNQILK